MSDTKEVCHVAIGILRSTNLDLMSEERGILIGSKLIDINTLSYLIAKSLFIYVDGIYTVDFVDFFSSTKSQKTI